MESTSLRVLWYLEHRLEASDILLAVNGEGAELPQAVGLRPTTARLPVPQVGYLLVYDTTRSLV